MVSAFGVMAAAAQNPNFAPGDLMLYFQQEGGTQTVYANLGNTANLYRGAASGPDVANSVNFLDISAALTSAFGPGWASDVTVYAGLAGVWGNSATSSTLQNGDPHRTLYVSSPRNDVGTGGQSNSTGWDLTLAGDTAMTGAAGGMLSQNNILETAYTTAVVVSPTTISTIDNQNPFLFPTIQGNAFQGAFAGGVQQVGTAGTLGSFGPAGSAEFALDLFRILAVTTAPGQVAGTKRVGTYEGTITVSTTGKVSFIAQGTATPFQTWALAFPALDTAAKRLPDADPDNDGLTNLMEFVLNGNPGTVDPSVVPTLNASGTDFVFSFARRDDSEAGSTLVFQYSTDLTGWTDTTVGASGGVVGAATVVVTENSTNPDAITVTVPKTTAPGGRLFGRLKVSQP